MLTAVLLLLAQPGEAVQTFDLNLRLLSWQRAKVLEGRRVRVRFTVYRVLSWRDPVVVLAEGPAAEWRFVRLTQRDLGPLTDGARLTAEGVLRVTWQPTRPGDFGWFIVTLESARLVK